MLAVSAAAPTAPSATGADRGDDRAQGACRSGAAWRRQRIAPPLPEASNGVAVHGGAPMDNATSSRPRHDGRPTGTTGRGATGPRRRNRPAARSGADVVADLRRAQAKRPRRSGAATAAAPGRNSVASPAAAGSRGGDARSLGTESRLGRGGRGRLRAEVVRPGMAGHLQPVGACNRGHPGFRRSWCCGTWAAPCEAAATGRSDRNLPPTRSWRSGRIRTSCAQR